ncbi:protein ROOT INITIATION DEFECTIVE 3 [Selaginella moellendorffii]|uniref:protein ROOT INITIATION DEFECTIVE 3 n=1 Tax=Selaginella moellendorffii TaxID=88036 RepID=UPI000D1CACE4|nr:protein ROOT INITIATION DEFECTIVE 3 [Selaginella moellendorffii]|eukprot:XP_024515322.1 protein ROOT INITIATION DEFECTIVE 3 [Selaginella moellendorffii]
MYIDRGGENYGLERAVLGWGKLATVREAVIACSNLDAGVTVWDLASGVPLSHLRSCAAPRNALACVGHHFLAASQIHKTANNAGGAIFFWTWHKNQVAFKSYPVEPIEPLACTADGVYLAGGGSSGRIYLWEVSSGRLLRVWAGHYKAVKCLVFSDDDSLLISGAEDGLVNVYPLVRALDSIEEAGETQVPYMHKWSDHTLPVTGLLAGSGGSSAIIVSCSLDHTCKIWSLALGALLRSILFPTPINAVALDPGEYALYAGGVDGRIFITALNFGVPSGSGLHSADGLLGADGIGHSRAITALAFSMDGVSLVSGSEDCTVRLWDTVSRQVLRTFSHSKGPVSSLLVIPRPSSLLSSTDQQGRQINRRLPTLPVVPLSKYVTVESVAQDFKPWEGPPVVLPLTYPADDEDAEGYSHSMVAMGRQIRELEQQGSTAAMQMELERLRSELRRALNNGQQWQQLHQELYCFCVDELMGGNRDREDDDGENKERTKGRASKVGDKMRDK